MAKVGDSLSDGSKHKPPNWFFLFYWSNMIEPCFTPTSAILCEIWMNTIRIMMTHTAYFTLRTFLLENVRNLSPNFQGSLGSMVSCFHVERIQPDPGTHWLLKSSESHREFHSSGSRTSPTEYYLEVGSISLKYRQFRNKHIQPRHQQLQFQKATL